MSNLLECTRCHTELKNVEPAKGWKRHFICHECWLAFRLVREWNKRHTNYTLYLEQGRERIAAPEFTDLRTSVSNVAWQASVMLAKGIKP